MKNVLSFVLVLIVASIGASFAEEGTTVEKFDFNNYKADGSLLCVSSASTSAGRQPILFGGNETAEFCDGTLINPGSSKSCKSWGKSNGDISCPAGKHIANLNCSAHANSACATGHACDCSWQCKKNTIAEPYEL